MLQYSPDGQLVAEGAPQLPVPSQVEDMAADQSLLLEFGQETVDPGNTQDVCVPSQYCLPQAPLPGQLERGVADVLHCPGICLHDWHSPLHLSLQQ